MPNLLSPLLTLTLPLPTRSFLWFPLFLLFSFSSFVCLNSLPLWVQDVDAPPIDSAKPPDEPKQGFWGALARKAKSILDDSEDPPSPHQPVADQVIPIPRRSLLVPNPIVCYLLPPLRFAVWYLQLPTPSPPPKSWPKQESPPAFQKGIGAIATSLNYIGNAVEVIFSLHFEVSYDSYTKFMVLSGYCPYWKHRCDIRTFQPGQWMDEFLAFDFLFMPHYYPHSSSSSAAKYIPCSTFIAHRTSLTF